MKKNRKLPDDLGANCCPFIQSFAKGQSWKIVDIKGGHVFAWITSGSKQPTAQYANCLWCGKPYHELFPHPKKLPV